MSQYVVWPPQEERLEIEAERILNEIQANARAAQQYGEEAIPFDWARLSMLLKLAMPKVPNDPAAFAVAATAFAEMLPDCAARYFINAIFDLKGFDSGRQGALMRLYREARWHEHGRPCVRLDGKLAASQMASDVSVDMLDELNTLEAPWPSFVIRLPQDLVMRDDRGRDYTAIGVHRFVIEAPTQDVVKKINQSMVDSAASESVQTLMRRMQEATQARAEGGPLWGLYLLTADGEGGYQEEATLGQFMGKQDRMYFMHPEEEFGPETRRLIEVSARLAAGICFMIHDSKVRRVSEKKKDKSRWRLSKLPETAEFIVGEDIRVSVDCREAVSEYIRGQRKAMPKVQWLVRGHWRWQAHGPNRSLRRRQFIEPYWKGPESAPILTRSHVLENEEKGEQS